MKRFALPAILALSGILLTLSPGNADAFGKGSTLNDTARYLAGLPGSTRTDLALSRNSPEWKAHAKRMNTLWSQHSGRRSHIKRFPAGSAGTVFYPFGGPDYLHANALFGGARNYILVGLEGVDAMPDLTKMSASELARGLNGISNSLRTVAGASYFITKDMRVDLASTKFRGTLPLIMAMAARCGNNISSVTPVGIGSSGNLTSRSGGASCPGWHIKAGGKNIYYFKEDLSNGGLGDKRLLRFVSSKGKPVVFVKSASYLMHGGGFSTIRNYILDSCGGLVQGASGIPYRNIKEAGWKIKLYGNYQGPIGTFSSKNQPDLAAAYRDGSHPVKPLSFGMGYLMNPSRACIIVARP